jgi:PAS domain S-box-containing protein
MSPVRILIADDHAVFRRSLRTLIESRSDWRVCGEAVDGEDAIHKFKELQPDVVLMDVSMPRMNGLDATHQILQAKPDANVVVVSKNDPKLMEKTARQAGAKVFVPKSDVAQELLHAVDGVVKTSSEADVPMVNSVGSEEPRLTSPSSRTGLRSRILLVDDDADMREYVLRLLQDRYEVLAVGDGEAALAGAREWRPHLILSDIMLPRLDGFEFVKAVRADESLKSIPIILLSARGGEEARAEGLSSGADDYLVKPFSVRELQARVRSHLTIAEIRGRSAELERKLRLDAEMLAAIVSSSDDAIVSKDLDGFITTWNKGAERIFGYTAEEAVGQHITLIIAADRRDEEADILARMRRGERVDHFQTVRRRKDGTLVDISVSVSPLRDSTGRVIGASKVARDITKQKRAEQAVRESEERFRAIVETTPECVKLIARDGTVLHINTSGLRMVGADCAEKVVGHSIYDVIAPEDRERFRAFNERVCQGERGSLEFDIVGLGGERRQMDTHAAPLHNPDGSVVQLAVTRDVTESERAEAALRESEERLRALAETLEGEVRARTNELEARNADVLRQSEQLRELSGRLLRTQDQERRHIARELHDSAGQTLTVLSMNLAQLVERAGVNSPELSGDAERIQEIVQQLSREIRTASYLLHPPLLDEAGLSSALEWYIQGLSERSGLEIKLDVPKQIGRLPRDMELAVFRLVQECLTNIHRHSGSKTAAIRLTRQQEVLTINIQDAGKGMSPARLAEIQSRGSGVGILGMRERLRQFHGNMKIKSGPTGTYVQVTIPIPGQSQTEEQESAHPLPAIQ